MIVPNVLFCILWDIRTVRMKKIVLLLAFCCLVIPVMFAQYNTPQNKVWTFGYGAGVSFASGSPVAITSSITTNEGCASVSDASGNLLFYTDGDTVFNKLGNIMPSGGGVAGFLVSPSSTTQAAAIVPVIGNPNQYYLFSLESAQVGTGRLVYCIVDMSLSGGLGDVVSSTAGTLLATAMGEHMTVVQGNNCNVWLMVHREDSTKFYVYNITATGIGAPVISNVGTFTAPDGYSIGHFMVSPDRTKVVSTAYNTIASYVANGVGTELYDFDPATGIVSNCRVLDSTNVPYGAEFSPDNSKLYVCFNSGASAPTYLTQYDVTLSSAAAISASAYTVYTSTFAAGVYPSLKLAVDNKIYLINMDTIVTRYLDCITNPNVSGAGCGFTSNAVTLVNGTYGVFGLPSIFVSIGGIDTISKFRDTTACSTVAPITLTATAGYTNYNWNTGGSTNTISAATSGNYIAFCTTGCHLLIDSIKATFDPYILTTAASDTSFCAPGSITLTAPNGFLSTTWQDGSTGSTFTTNAPGIYYVDEASYCADHVDSFHVSSKSLSVNLGSDTTVCMNYEIKAPVTGNNVTYIWQDGSRNSTYSASHTGEYYVTVNRDGCDARDTVNVTFFHFAQNIHDTFICKGEPININLQCTVPQGGHVMWNDGVTSPTRTVTDSGTWWVFVSKDECEILDTVRVTTGYCKCWYNVPEAFTPNDDGLNDIVRPLIQPGCTISGYQFNIYNRWGELIFSSDFRDKGWDGKFNGVPLDLGVYMYSLQFFIGEKETPVIKSGTITLVR